MGFHENREHWASAGCALNLRTLFPIVGLCPGEPSPCHPLMVISRNCGCLGSSLLPAVTVSSLQPSQQCLGSQLGNDWALVALKSCLVW